jgi:hypothetical protein
LDYRSTLRTDGLNRENFSGIVVGVDCFATSTSGGKAHKLITHENLGISKELFTIDELNNRTPLNTSRMAAILLSLELQNIIHIIPGKMIALA